METAVDGKEHEATQSHAVNANSRAGICDVCLAAILCAALKRESLNQMSVWPE